VCGMKTPKVIVFPLRRPPLKRFSQWPNDFRIDPPRAIRRYSPRIAVLPSNVIVCRNSASVGTAAHDL
jgi:hypothetical protein